MFYVKHLTNDSPFATVGSNGGGHRETTYACERVEHHVGNSVVLIGSANTGVIAHLMDGQVFVMNADGKTIDRMNFTGAASIEEAAAIGR